MSTPAEHAIAIVGVGAILPDAPDADAFWHNITGGRYSISEVDPRRWDPELYYDADPHAPDRTYSKIGGWVRDWQWEPLAWHLPIPPTVSEAMDDAQKWGVACTRMALADYGWPERPLDLERTAVVLGNAMAGEHHYLTSMRLSFPEIARELAATPTYAGLPAGARAAIAAELHANVEAWLPPTTEDTMPGELGNCLAGRIANLFNLRGPNFVVDAACASAMAAMDASIEGLVEGEFDAVLTGGIDRNMSAATFIKFCAIGALSATGTRPYRDGADGFVMGEGAGLMLLKRLTDAERDGDRIYAVVRGIAGSSDGKGKGITAPNPIGQKLAVERAWAKSGLSPDVCGLIEGHGTSTRVGDVVELTALAEVFAGAGLAPGSVPIGSVKSNIGHLKGAAGAAGLLKAALSLHHKVLPPSLGGEPPNPNLDWSASPFAINTELREWEASGGAPRVAGVSAFGFGGTNFHAVLEEYVPGRFASGGNGAIAVSAEIPESRPNRRAAAAPAAGAGATKAPLRGALVLGAVDDAGLATQLRALDGAPAPAIGAPDPQALRAPERIAIDYGDDAELHAKAALALKALEGGGPGAWKALRARGIFRGGGPAPKLAFLYTGQGSQYANMLADLRSVEPIVAATFAEADEVMRPLLDGRALSDVIFVDPADAAAVAQATAELMRTEITQPAVLTVDIALTRLLAAYGIEPEIVMGHSLGEYGALVAAGVLPFTQALEAVSARGHEMASLDLGDPGAMAAVAAPPEAVEAVIAQTDGYVVLANVNSSQQVVLGGATQPVHDVVARLQEQGHQAMTLPVSHAFHTEIVAPASEPLRATLRRLDIAAPRIPVVANVDGELYPTGPDAVERIIDILGRQVASPVQFVAGLRTLWAQGARVFVEAGPKRALQGFASDVLGDDDALNLHTNHPKSGDLPSFNIALCGLYASGYGAVQAPAPASAPAVPAPVVAAASTPPPPAGASSDATLLELGRLFADTLQRGRTLLGEDGPTAMPQPEPVVITGAGIGLPGTERIFDEHNLARILHGEQFIDVIPQGIRHAIADRHITRLVKGDDGQATFEEIDDVADVIKLAARAGAFDLESEFGVDAGRIAALGRATQLAVAAGIDALRDAGIPLVQHYRDTTTGTQLPDRWALPDALRDDTGIVFGSAFPGYDEFADELDRFWADRSRRDQLTQLVEILARVPASDEVARAEIERRIHDVRLELDEHAYAFDRRFLFRVLSMGHSQFAELIGARGPNTQLNAACASTTQAVAVAQDWIRAGRCRRVIVIAADDATSDEMLPWIGSGFLASGAAATDEAVEDAALPFDVRRHGMLLGMGAAALVVESAAAARERGITPICEVLGAVTANSAFHGTRLDVEHIGQVMEGLVAGAEDAGGVARAEIAPELVFVSHETYTPARGGSAAAEIHALRQVFGDRADSIVIANTKGITGHPMGVGLEDVVAVKTLETGVVPPVPNFRDIDPSLGALNLSKGGAYPVRFALRLAAGFGSQIAMLLLRWTPVADGRRRNPEELGFAYRVSDRAVWDSWLARVSGQADPRLEVVQHRLRVVDRGPGAAAAPAATAASTPVSAAASVPAAAPAAEAPAAQPAGDPALDSVLAVVAEQTGYPTDLLDPDLDLEADLGIDTVKQAEVFATIREAWDIPRDDTLKLRDYPTLNHVAQFVRDHTDTPAPADGPPATAPATAPAAEAPAAQPAGDPALDSVLAVVAEQTGYPTDLLDPDLDLEADLGIDTVKQAEVFATIREAWDIPRDDTLKLRDYPTLNHVAQFVRDHTDTPAPADGPPATAPATAPAAEAPAAQPAGDPALDSVLAVVAEQTGYPTDLLDPDLDLEADLGIDTVKQAEVFATIREAWDIPRDDTLKLRDYPTLNHVAQFVRDHTDTPAPADGPPATAPAPGPADELDDEDPDPSFPRRVPTAVVRPPLDRCLPTGVTLGAGARIILAPDAGGVGAALTSRLEALGAEVLVLDTALDVAGAEEHVADWLRGGPITGVYWLPALDDEGPLSGLDPAGWRDGLHRRVKLLAATMRPLEPQTFLVSATRLGGRLGYDDAGATSVMGGAVSGFTKALARERADALVKVVDVPPSRKTSALADVLVEETLRDPGAVEIGRAEDLRWTVALREQPAHADPARALTPATTFLVTGAAGSIVSAITADLAAAAGGGTFHLLDLIGAPDPADPDLEAIARDRDGLKPTITQRLRDAGQKPTPKLVERELAGIERRRAALDAIEAVEAAGGAAHWHQCDLTDAAQVAAAVEAAVGDQDTLDVLLHCAGLEISHVLPDKPQAEYDLVFDVKADGWFHLLHALGDRQPGTAVVFSSIAGRFGNGGQTDYSAANDLLCKSVSRMRRDGVTRGVAVDWTAWSGIGMASRGSIPKMMEAAGIDMLPPDHGVPVVRRELTAGGDGGEVVVAGALGILLEERHPTGGLDPDAAAGAAGPMAARVTAFGVADGALVETELDPAREPFLDDHRIDGTPVLPGVMGMEGFAETAAALLPGWRVVALEDVDLRAPLKFYRDEPRTLEFRAQTRDGGDGTLLADCRLVGRRALAGQGEQETVHFTGRARLSRDGAPPPADHEPPQDPGDDGSVGRDAVYRVYFHGPAYQVLDHAWREDAQVVGRLADELPADHAGDAPLAIDPRLIELCFQTAGVWELGTSGRMALPTHVDRAALFDRDGLAAGPRWAIVTPRGPGVSDADVVDEAGRVLLRLEGYRTIELPGGPGEPELAPIREAMS